MRFAASHQTVRRLTYFAAIAEAGTIRGGAEVLGLSVPVLSAALSELEEELGVTLAVRSTRSFQLTPAGEEVHKAASEVMRAAQRASEVVGPQTDKPLRGLVSMSVTTEMATHWLPRRLARFSARHPELTLHVDVRDDIVPLKMSRFDLAIRMRGPVSRADAGDAPFVDLCCVLPPGVTGRVTAQGWSFDLPLLAASDGVPELWGHRYDTGQAVRVAFSTTLTVTNREAARRMAAEGLGAALVLGEAARRDAERGDIALALPEVDFGVVCHRVLLRDALPSPAARAFVAFLEGEAG